MLEILLNQRQALGYSVRRDKKIHIADWLARAL
jgi:hypothetical protein